jgi:ketosteroid isomerase-like protein
MADTYDSPQDCEDAFYDAFEEGDLEKMMACWVDDDAIACVHPTREEIRGRATIRESWDQIFRADANIEIEIHHRLWIEAQAMAVHIVHEQLIFNGNRRQSPPPLIATNVYRREASGWRLVLHHASPPPPPPAMMRPSGPPPGSITH